jgi:hypothetical protein
MCAPLEVKGSSTGLLMERMEHIDLISLRITGDAINLIVYTRYDSSCKEWVI